MKRLLSLLLGLVIVCSLAACGGKTPAPAAPTEAPAANADSNDAATEPASTRRKIGVFNYNSMMPSANPIIEGMVDVIEEHGDEYVYVAADGTEANQLQVFDELVARDDLDAIVWPNINDTVLLDSSKRAAEKGIILATMDMRLEDDENTRVVASQTLVDNYQGSYNVADALLTQLEKNGTPLNIIMVNYSGAALFIERANGYKDACTAHSANVLYEVDIATGDDLSNTIEDLLIRYPETTGILVCYDAGCVKTLAACKAQGRTDILLCSFDGGTDVQEYILKGEIFAAACQPLYEMGRNTAESAYKALNGEEQDYWYNFQCKILTQENVQEVIDQFNAFTYRWMD